MPSDVINKTATRFWSETAWLHVHMDTVCNCNDVQCHAQYSTILCFKPFFQEKILMITFSIQNQLLLKAVKLYSFKIAEWVLYIILSGTV